MTATCARSMMAATGTSHKVAGASLKLIVLTATTAVLVTVAARLAAPPANRGKVVAVRVAALEAA